MFILKNKWKMRFGDSRGYMQMIQLFGCYEVMTIYIKVWQEQKFGQKQHNKLNH